MKKISFIVLSASMLIILWFFVKEQFRGDVLSHKENTVLSVTYLMVGFSLIALYRLKYIENKKKGNSEK